MQLSRSLGRLVIAGLLTTLCSVCESGLSCPTGLSPAGLAPGFNDAVRGQALYWLDLGRARFGYRPHHLYKLDITSQDTDHPFSDAILTLEEEDPKTGCGIGQFQFETDDLFQYSDCDKILMTNKKQPMTQLPPFLWKAPGCGCVIVNATVIRDGSTYYMDETMADGVLSKRICPRQHTPSVRTTYKATPTTTLPPATPQKPKQIKTMTRTDRMDLLCKISVKFQGAEMLVREVFLTRRQISSLNLTSLVRLELALNQRRGDIHECCKRQPVAAKTRCFDNKRRRRIDRFCRVGVPDIPFTARRAAFMKEREQECCWRLGELRYRCFGEKSNDMPDKRHNSIEYSLDEMDPVNDIGDYPSEIEEVEKDINSNFFVDNAKTDVVIQVKETVTYTVPTSSPTTTQATTTTTVKPEVNVKKHDTGNPVIRRHLSSGVVSDFTHTEDAKSTVKDIIPTSTKKSAVEEELEVLRLKAWRVETKLACCRKGKSEGENIESQQSIYNHCRHQWRIYRKTLRKGKNMCMNKFMECCVDEAGMSSTQATYTQNIYPSHTTSQTRTKATTTPNPQPTLKVTAVPVHGQGFSRGTPRKVKSRPGKEKEASYPRRKQSKREKDNIRVTFVGPSSSTLVPIQWTPEVTSPPSLTTPMVVFLRKTVSKGEEADQVGMDKEVDREDNDKLDREDNDKLDREGNDEVDREDNDDVDREDSEEHSDEDKADGEAVDSEGVEEDNDEESSEEKMSIKSTPKTVRVVKHKRKHVISPDITTTTIRPAESTQLDSVSKKNNRKVKGKPRSNSRPKRIKKHRRRHKKRRHRHLRTDKS